MEYYVVDAFTNKVFKGNPAGVCILEHEIDPNLMQNIAAENCLSETAFVVPLDKCGEYDLRWFTPVAEIDLCGHATLASAAILFSNADNSDALDQIIFHTMSGEISVKKVDSSLSKNASNNASNNALENTSNDDQALYQMTLPRRELKDLKLTVELIKELEEILGEVPLRVGYSRDIVVELADVTTIRNLKPDFHKMQAFLNQKDYLGFVVTAPVRSQSEIEEDITEPIDFVSRYFCPELDQKEDPVTGSSHSNLIPYWANRLGKKQLIALQLSKRTGILYCEDTSYNKVLVSGKAAMYLKGKLYI